MSEIINTLFVFVRELFRFIINNPIVYIPIGILLVALIIKLLIIIKQYRDYKNCTYYQITKVPFKAFDDDLGRYGEYLTYKRLKGFEKEGAKFLFNVYIPKENDETTEIDVLMISKKGLFVFESKNYSGWIFGSERQTNWYQTLPTGRRKSHKENFYNPIMQNRSHIKHLKAFVGEQFLMHSIIVFSERCTLKNVSVKSNDIYVINRDRVSEIVADIYKKTTEDVLTETDIATLYAKLYPCTQVSDAKKIQHIINIKNKIKSESAATPNEPKTDLNDQVEKTEDAEPNISAGIINESGEASEVNEAQQTKSEEANQTPQTESEEANQAPQTESEEANKAQQTESEEAKQAQQTESEEATPVESTEDVPLNNICPRCGGNLVLKTATRGANAGNRFFGCSNYPKCRYIQNIEKPIESDNQVISSQ